MSLLPLYYTVVIAAWVPSAWFSPLTTEEESTIRKIVSSGHQGTAVYKDPKLIGIEFLPIHEELTDAYKRRPVTTVLLLVKIIEGGNPKDSVFAAALAISLRNDKSALGATILGLFNEKTYDQIDANWKQTP